MSADPILIRPCEGFEELSACVQLQVDVWGYGDRDVMPRRVFIVSKSIGGQVMGAFDTSLPGVDRKATPIAWSDLPWLCLASRRGGRICTPTCWR